MIENVIYVILLVWIEIHGFDFWINVFEFNYDVSDNYDVLAFHCLIYVFFLL